MALYTKKRSIQSKDYIEDIKNIDIEWSIEDIETINIYRCIRQYEELAQKKTKKTQS